MRLVHEIAQNCPGNAFIAASEWHFKSEAIKALQHACEDFLTEMNEGLNLCAIHAKRVTIQLNDLHLAVKLRHDKEKMRANVKWTN